MSLSVMENILAEFGASIGIPDLRPDAEQRCNLMFDDVAVSFELGGGDESLYIYALLGDVPETGAEAAYADLLGANYSFGGTGGSTLSVDPQTGGIVLIREERLEALRLPTFEAVVQDFVNVAEQWMNRIRSGEFGGPGDDVPEDSQPPGGGMMRV